MKQIIIALCMLSGSVMATEWATCVEYWYSVNVSSNVPHVMQIVNMTSDGEGGVDIVWKITPSPTKSALVAMEPAALAWKSNQVAEAAADIDKMEIKDVLRALVKTLNKRLPADKQVTEAELKAAIKAEVTK